MPFKYKPDEPMPPVRNREEGGLRDAAMTWANMGFALIPVRPGEKAADPEPLGGTGYRLTDAGIVDPQRVYEIYSATPGHNIAATCGDPSGGLLIIDCDKKRPTDKPLRSLARWQSETGIDIPDTAPMVETANGGLHIYLLKPEGVGHVPSPKGWLANVDIRCDGSYALLPPSFLTIDPREDNSEDYPDGVKQYGFLDLGGSHYSPTPNEFLAELEQSVAPLDE